MMILGHRTVAAPCALVMSAALQEPAGVEIIASLIVVWTASWNDLDHKFGTASNEFGFISRAVSRLVRFVSYSVYLATRTKLDKDRKDAHRGFTHTVEGCALFAGVVWVVAALIPFTSSTSWVWALATMVGTFSHLIGDMMTPSGVPFQITIPFNGMRWQRYAFGWEKHYFWWRLYWPEFTIVTIDGKPRSREERRRFHPGLFRTNSGWETNLAIPLIWFATAVGVLIYTGAMSGLLSALTGVDIKG